jgi:aminocarboxymuconate-semialdehyde decarboxylase
MTSASAVPEPTRRRETVVNGKRVRVIDMHAHCAVPEANAVMGMEARMPALLVANVATRLAAMDAQGIDIEALSINPFWYKADRDVAAKLIDVQNQRLAEFVAAQPERFVALASVALQHPDLAAQQLEDGVKKYNLRGALVGGSVNGEELADARYHPFWAKAEELGCLENVIGNPLETTIALSHLIFEGTLDRFPGLKILAAHGGGYLPSYAPRSDHGGMTFPDRFTPLKRRPTEYLRGPQLYFDSLVFTPEALRHLIAETGLDRIVLGTDYPFPWTSTSVEHVMETPGLTDDQRTAILGGTAAQLLKLDS